MRVHTIASLAVASLTLGVGCSTSETGGGGPTVLGPPSFTIDAVNGAAPGAGPLEVTLGCDDALFARVTLKNWLLRPPGACFGGAQCGQLAMIVDPTPADDAGEDGAIVALSSAPLVQADLGELASLEGEHLLRIELRDDGERRAATGPDGEPLAQQLVVKVGRGAECDAGAEAGADSGEEADAGADAADAAEEAGPDAGPDAESDAGADAAESDAEPDAEMDAPSDVESDAAGDADAEGSADAESDADEADARDAQAD